MQPFCYIYIYQSIMLYTLNLYNVMSVMSRNCVGVEKCPILEYQCKTRRYRRGFLPAHRATPCCLHPELGLHSSSLLLLPSQNCSKQGEFRLVQGPVQEGRDCSGRSRVQKILYLGNMLFWDDSFEFLLS